MLKTIGILGGGFVGKAVVRGFNLFADVKLYDIDPSKSTHSFEEAINSDFVFVCLPTPMETAEGGKCDLSIIESVFKKIVDSKKRKKNTIFVVKSTVPIRTVKNLVKKFKLKIVHNPEFLTARAAILDFIVPARNIVGGKPKLTKPIAEFLRERFPGVPCYEMSSDESEMVKYMANCFFATKVLYFNELRLLCDKLKLNWDKVLEGVMSDGRIAKSHYQVPGHDGFRGTGGLCFPKDINALISVFEGEGLDPLILKAVWEQNKRVRPKEGWDWADSPSAVSNKKAKK